MEEFIKRENGVFEILNKFIDAGLDFIVVGGYAVSAFKHRFSIDADIIVNSENLNKFAIILEKNSFQKSIEKNLENIYSSRFVRYEKPSLKVYVDLLIDGLASRQTNASFSYDLIMKNSEKRKIIGIEKEIIAKVPTKELLITMKIHSGRLTDFRDIAALAKNTNLEKIEHFLFRGDIGKLNKKLGQLNKTAKNNNFINSFKGVFLEKEFDVDLNQVEKISSLRLKRIN